MMEGKMSGLVPPHGGKLRLRFLGGEELREKEKRARGFPRVRMSSRETSDLIMMGMGAFSPLEGFMGEEDYLRVVSEMRLTDGSLWPIPITLSVTKEEANALKEGQKIALVSDESNVVLGSMVLRDRYTYDKRREAREVFLTTDEAHPGVDKIYRQGETLLGGPVQVFSEGDYPQRFGGYYARPEETRRIFEERGWSTVAAFQVRNPIHRSHEYCTKIALEICDGLFIHPLVGRLKEGDIPAEVRIRCYEVLLERYYPQDRVVLKVYPMEMRYAGPREALLHAIFRQNFGCSHLIVGRDHAGVGDYYGPFDAQHIFDQLAEDDLHIRPLKIDWTFYCYKCQSMASMKTCPHRPEDRCLISGTKLREMLSKGKLPPPEFSRPEVLEILVDYYKDKSNRPSVDGVSYQSTPPPKGVGVKGINQRKARNITWHPHKVTKEQREKLLGHRGVTLWFTGLPSSGKSSIANEVAHLLHQRGCVTVVLDGDNIRHGLNKDLGFSPQDRQENIRRIGEVAHLFTENGVITLTAFISPYRSDRDRARALAKAGDFIEIYVDTPLRVCEERDPKGLFKKAREGQIPEFTGISAPYEPPHRPEIHLKAGGKDIQECAAEVMTYLEVKGIVPSS